MVANTNQKKRSYWLAAMLGLVALAIYAAFMWMTGKS